jgi:uncharacterized protein (DUF305 family)
MFAQMVIPHHQQAIEMADLALKNAQSADVTDLAGQIKAAQNPEIRTMTQWLRDWEAAAPTPMGHGGSGGMMSEAEMSALASAQGADFDRMWLTMMIKHHQGAVEMAETEVAKGRNADAKTLADEIIKAQNAEITEMTALLQNLRG